MIALNAINPDSRRDYNYWMALVAMVVLLGAVFALLRGRLGASVQAIRDDEDAAESVGVRVLASKRTIFVLAAFGCALAGSLWLATSITLSAEEYFGIQWTAYMIFMVLVGGLGTFRGPDPRRRHFLPDRIPVRRDRGLVSHRIGRGAALSSRYFCRAASGARSKTSSAFDSFRSATACGCCEPDLIFGRKNCGYAR